MEQNSLKDPAQYPHPLPSAFSQLYLFPVLHILNELMSEWINQTFFNLTWT